MTDESPAHTADREAARIAFIREFRQHALDDVFNRAPAQIRVRLRSPENLKMWAQTLDQLKREISTADGRQLVAGKIAECAAMRQAEVRIAMITAQGKISEANKEMRHANEAAVSSALASIGFTQPQQMGLQQVNAILMCQAIREIAELRAAVEGLKANQSSQSPSPPQAFPNLSRDSWGGV